MISSATQEQWNQIEDLKNTAIAGITHQPPDDEVIAVVKQMWKRMGKEPKAVLIADCPVTAMQWFYQLSLRSEIKDIETNFAQKIKEMLATWSCQQDPPADSKGEHEATTNGTDALKTTTENTISPAHESLTSQLYSQLWLQLRLQLSSQLNSQLVSQLYSQLVSQLSSQLSSQLNSRLVSQLSSQLSSQLNSQLDSQLVSQLREQLYLQLHSQLDSQLDSQLVSQLDSQLRSRLRSQLYSQLFSQLNSQLDSQLDSQLRSQLYSRLRSQLCSRLNEQLDSQLRSQLYSQLHSQLSSQLCSQLDSQLYSQLCSQLHSQLSSQLREQLSSQLDSQLSEQLSEQLHSQLHSQLYSQLYSQLDSQLSSQLWRQLRARLREPLDLQLHSQLSSQLHSQLCSQLGSQLDSRLREQLREQLNSQLRLRLGSLVDHLRAKISETVAKELANSSPEFAKDLNNYLVDISIEIAEALESADVTPAFYSYTDSRKLGELHDLLQTTTEQAEEQLKTKTEELSKKIKDQLYVSVWWRTWSCWYEGGKILGVQFSDNELYELFRQWSVCVPIIFANESIPIVCRWPTQVHWKNELLHNETGKAIEFASGWGTYSIEGVTVDEQIVLRPETQTVDQIFQEPNEEVRRIRIERFGGWEKFIRESGAVLKDSRWNERDCQQEELYELKNGAKRLMCVDPSTGRKYAIGVDSGTENCEQAQLWMSSGLDFYAIHRS